MTKEPVYNDTVGQNHHCVQQHARLARPLKRTVASNAAHRETTERLSVLTHTRGLNEDSDQLL